MPQENKPQRGYVKPKNIVRSMAHRFSGKRGQRNPYHSEYVDKLIEVIDEMDLPPTGQTYPNHWDWE